MTNREKSYGVTALRLQTLVNTGNEQAKAVLRLRRDSNFVLTTIQWGNAGINLLPCSNLIR